MAHFDQKQLLRILAATNETTFDREEANRLRDEKDRAAASSTDTFLAPSGGDLTTFNINPPTPAHVSTEFNCPLPGSGDCFERVEREDVTEEIVFVTEGTPDNSMRVVDLDNVRGMNLCYIEGLFSFLIDSAAMPQPTEIEIKAWLREVDFMTTFGIEFRGRDVSNFKDIALSSISPGFDCCETTRLCVDCKIPQQGGMKIVSNVLTGPVPPAWVLAQTLMMRLKFSGCGCSCGKNAANCGCN